MRLQRLLFVFWLRWWSRLAGVMGIAAFCLASVTPGHGLARALTIFGASATAWIALVAAVWARRRPYEP